MEKKKDSTGISVIMPVLLLDDGLVVMTQKAIESVKGHELIIIDNGSPIKRDFDCDIMIRNKNNLGVARAWNQGLKLASGEKLVIVNNDIEACIGWEIMLKSIDNEIHFPAINQRDGMEFKQKMDGCFWAMDRKTYHKLGDVSEDYGIANFEDTDYFMRAMQEGVRLRSIAEAKVVHYGRATADKIQEVQDIYDENKVKFFKKYNGNHPFI